MKKYQTAVLLLWFGWIAYPVNVMGQVPSLTIEQLKNATYLVIDERIKLKNGLFERGKYPDPDILYVSFDKAALGDLNNDGKNDAAVLYDYNSGGSGCFVLLGAMINQNGNPVQVAAVDLGDRVVVKSISIKGGKIILNMVLHGPNDSLAQPKVNQTRKYILAGNKLVLSR